MITKADSLDSLPDSALNELFAVKRKRNPSVKSRSPEYISWAAMMFRCRNPKAQNYQRYGGAGVMVCERWADSFEAFAEDMGGRPAGTSLDRFPLRDGHYEPSNCRWATLKQQSRNTKANTRVSAFGETKTIADWGDDQRFSVSAAALGMRLKRGVPPEQALTMPSGKHFRKRK